MRRTTRTKDKNRHAATGEPRVADIAALIEQSAEAFRARTSKRSSGSSADEQLAPVEGIIEAQIDFNNTVGGAIKVVAQHLLYAHKNFEAMEKHDEAQGARNARAREQMREQLSNQMREQLKKQAEELHAALEAVGGRIESYGLRLSELEQRVERELDEIRRSIAAGTTTPGDAGRRPNKHRNRTAKAR